MHIIMCKGDGAKQKIRVALWEYWFCCGFGTALVLVNGGGGGGGGGGGSCSGSNSCSSR